MSLTLVHLIATAAMVGVIWLVQLTHYPTYRFIDPARFADFERFHCSSISFVVLPLMMLELGSAVLIVVAGEYSSVFVISLLALAGIWASTFFIQVPLHEKLGAALDRELVESLVRTNWIRTVLWTIRLTLILS